ncbi:MAG: ROK family transcriptional regulator [Acidimicrobiales bacterium]
MRSASTWELMSDREILPQQLVRMANERRIFHHLRQQGPLSRAGLVRLTGLSGQSVGIIVGRLLDQGLVEEIGTSPQSGLGRKPIGVRIHPEGALAYGCNIERDRIDGAWINLNGDVVVSGSDSFAQGEKPERIIRRVEDLYERLSLEVTGERFANKLPAIGLGLPGPIDPFTQALVNPPNFPHWEGIDPRTLFSSHWTLPIFCENSSTAAALGEAWQSRTNLRNFLYCHWGVGIGGGLVIELDTYRGVTGNAVELGHVPVIANGEACGCGARGCLEAEASVAAICRQAARLGFDENFDAIVAIARDDGRVASIFERAGELLAQALLGAVNLFDVDSVVIGGHHFREVSEWLMPPVEAAVGDLAMRRNVRKVSVQYSIVDEAAGAVGAASVVFDKLLPTSPPLVPANERSGRESSGPR